MPIEPPPTMWELPEPTDAPDDLVGVGADLEPGTVLAAYRAGLFPMPVDIEGEALLGWWSPDPRGILPLDALRVSRSLARSMRRFEIRVDTAFEAVIEACGDPGRDGMWISPAIRAAYVDLHRRGWVHSVEAWSRGDGSLAGGLYGVSIGGLFAGESMFHHRPDASKAALVALVDMLSDGCDRLLDVQWTTSHLASLGARDIRRVEYLARLAEALHEPLPAAFSGH